MSPVLPVEGDERCGVHEAAGARWHTVLLQRSVQHLCARGMCGKLLTDKSVMKLNNNLVIGTNCNHNAESLY